MITLDANIYISAFKFGRKPMELLERAARGEVEIAVSQAIIDETCRILRDKFHFPEARVEESRSMIEAIAVKVDPGIRLDVMVEDPDDDRILECAVESRSDTIVTGDKALLSLGEYDGIRIVRLSEYLARSNQRV